MYALRKHLLYESDDDKTQLLSLLQQLNIETDSIGYDNQNSKSSYTNYNNSYIPIEKDNLSALYTHYQIDPHMYPSPDLQLYKSIQPYSRPSQSYLQPPKLQNSSLSEQQRNSSNSSTRRSRSWRKKQKQKRSETNHFHYRNMITVRRISCHDMLDSQMTMKKRFKYKQNSLKNEWNKNTRTASLTENKSQKYKTLFPGFKSSPSLVELHTPSIESTVSKSLVSPSPTNSNTKTLTTPISNSLIQQQEHKKKMSNSMSVIGVKVTSLRDSSASSLVSTQLFADAYNQTKPNVTTTTTTAADSQIDSGSIADHSPHLSTTAASIVPHFPSTIAPHVPHHISSSTIAIANIPKIESVVAATSTNENIHDLVGQLKTCIATLSLLLKNKTEHEKLRIPNLKSYSNEKRNRTKKKQLQPSPSSLSLASASDCSRFSKKAISNDNNLLFEDITVRRCSSANDQERKKYQSNIPALYNDQHEKLERCLLVHCRKRANKDRGRNINSNERQRNFHCTWNDLVSNKHLLSSQFSQSIRNNSINVLSVSKSTLILAEEDDEYINHLMNS